LVLNGVYRQLGKRDKVRFRRCQQHIFSCGPSAPDLYGSCANGCRYGGRENGTIQHKSSNLACYFGNRPRRKVPLSNYLERKALRDS
jgi:hypothetical protein